MLITPITDAAKANLIAKHEKFVAVKQAKLSKDVIDWLRQVKTNRVYVVGLAVDFYLSSFMQDILIKRISGENGFDPLTGYDYYIVNDVNFNAWIGSLQESVAKSIDWQDSFMFTYLCAAVAGELRHCPSSVNEHDKQKLHEFGVLNSYHQADLVRAMTQKRFLETVSDDTVNAFLKVAVDVFRSGKWGSGYGGPKWGEIAVTGLNRFEGRMTQTQFIDRVYDLKHNGGPMFDKNKAVVNDGLSQFLDAKFGAKTDLDWAKWVNRYASAEIRNFISRATDLNLWQGAKPTGVPFKPIVGNVEEQTSDNEDEPEVEPAWVSQSVSSWSAPKKESQAFTMPNLNNVAASGTCANKHQFVISAISLPEKA